MREVERRRRRAHTYIHTLVSYLCPSLGDEMPSWGGASLVCKEGLRVSGGGVEGEPSVFSLLLLLLLFLEQQEEEEQ